MLRLNVRSPAAPEVAYCFAAARVTVGRSDANGLCLLDAAVSRLHAEFRLVAGSWCVLDRSSRNGTLLNGQPFAGLKRLAPGDEVALGRTVLVFDEVRSVAPGTPAAPGEKPTIGSALGTGDLIPPSVLVGASPAIRELRLRIGRVAPANSTVLITGETGTGKELVAAQIHARSQRARRPFVAVNCAALPGNLLEAELFGIERGVATGVEARAGRFERAHGGTLLLDEIGDMEITAQAKLLRVLEEGRLERIGAKASVPLDARILAATNQDLEAAVADRRFRRDLYYRLRVVRIHIPPLRERREDLVPLTHHFLRLLGRDGPDIEREAMDHLLGHDFPGNVRELENLLEQACLTAEGGAVRIEHLDLAPGAAGQPPSVIAVERPAGASAPPPRLFDRLVSGELSFWPDVARPYLRRQIPPQELRALIQAGYDATGSYRKMSRLFRIESDYKKLLNFVGYHQLGVR